MIEFNLTGQTEILESGVEWTISSLENFQEPTPPPIVYNKTFYPYGVGSNFIVAYQVNQPPPPYDRAWDTLFRPPPPLSTCMRPHTDPVPP